MDSKTSRDRVLSVVALVILGSYMLYGMTHPDFAHAMLRLSSRLP